MKAEQFVKWNRKDNLNYEGRNRIGSCQGLEIFEGGDRITLFPLNSRGRTEACWIDLPKEAIPEVINILQEAMKE